MAAEKSKRSSIGDFFTKLFRPRSASLGKDGIRKPESVRKKPKSMSKSASFDDSFGIEATDRLTHFQKPKPPPNRRRPRGLPSLQQSQQHEVEAIKEEVQVKFKISLDSSPGSIPDVLASIMGIAVGLGSKQIVKKNSQGMAKRGVSNQFENLKDV